MSQSNRTNDVAREIAAATAIAMNQFLLPACKLLFQLLEHQKPGVRLYGSLLLAHLAIDNIAAFTVAPLSEVAYRLRTLVDSDPDERVRTAALVNLERLMEAAVEFGAASKSAKYSWN